MPLAAGNFVASLSSAALVERYGRGTLTAGAALQAAGLLLLIAAAGPRAPVAVVLAGVTVFGLGQGLLIPPIIGVVLSRVPAADSGAATGVLITIQQMSGTVGLALVSLGFFAAVGTGQAGHVVAGFRLACACDVALALGSLALSRLLAPADRPPRVVPESDVRELLVRAYRNRTAEMPDKHSDEPLALGE